MTLATGASLLPATFRGIPFLYRSNSTRGGRKYKRFEYPNRDTRTVQDLGKLQRIYSVDAIIQGNDVTYPLLVKLFKDALEKEGVGILSHPTEGIVRVFATPYVLQESWGHVGVAKFTLNFLVVADQQLPAVVQTIDNAAQIAQLALGVISVLNQIFISGWGFNQLFPQIANASQQFVNQLGTFFSNVKNTVLGNNITGLETFNITLTKYQNESAVNVLDGNQLATQTGALFSQLGDVTTDVTNQLQLMQQFFNYSSRINTLPTTKSGEIIVQNQLIFDQYVNSQALIYAYIFASQTSYETVNDVQSQSALLNTQYAYIVQNNNFVTASGKNIELLDQSFIDQINNLRSNMTAFFNSLDAIDRKVVPISVASVSLLPFTYQYYGNLDNFQTLVDLNDTPLPLNITNSEFLVISNEN